MLRFSSVDLKVDSSKSGRILGIPEMNVFKGYLALDRLDWNSFVGIGYGGL